MRKGHHINGIYLFGSGVTNLNKKISIDNNMRNLPEKLQTFTNKHNISVGGCSTWISYTGLNEENFIQNACQVGLPTLNEWLEESDKVIAFGGGW